VIGIHK